MRHRTTFILFVFFLTGVCVLWWTDYADIPTRERQQELLNRLLPELIDTPSGDIQRIEVDRRSGSRKDRIVVERTDERWQLKEPVDTAADPELVETLARNLRDLRKSPFAGTIVGDPAPYGLVTPEAQVKVFVKKSKEPIVSLDLGKTFKDRAYVRPGAGSGIEVVDPRILSALTLPVLKWRDTALLHVPSFKVERVDINETQPDVKIALQRDDRRWKLVNPIKVLADNDKAEGLVAELAALRVMDINGDSSAFVADDVTDLARYGLETPAMTITVSPFKGQGEPQTVKIGKPIAPDKPNEVYAMRGDQNEVVRLDVKRLREAIPGVNGLRSQTVLDFTPARVDRLRINSAGTLYDLLLTRSGWRLLSPVKEAADNAGVNTLLTRLAELKTSQFLKPDSVNTPKLDSPDIHIRGWQGGTDSKNPEAEPSRSPQFDLSLGRYDALKKSVYGRIQGDTAILALSDSILKEIPRNAFAFRDRKLLDLKPPDFTSVTIEHPHSSVTVEAPPTTGAKENHWRMTEPVKAAVDDAAVTALLLTIGNLHAESWESDVVGDGHQFGLDAPGLRLKWTLQPGSSSTEAGQRVILRIGQMKPDGASYYANFEGDEKVFTVNPNIIKQFEAELHSHTLFRFKPADANQVVLRWPTRTVSLEKRANSPYWEVTRGYDPTGVNVSRLDAIVTSLAGLNTPRFIQYEGPLREAFGFSNPWVTVRWKVAGKPEEFTLRVGTHLGESDHVATTASGREGPAFLVPADALKEILKPPRQPDDLPEEVFVPSPTPASKADLIRHSGRE